MGTISVICEYNFGLFVGTIVLLFVDRNGYVAWFTRFLCLNNYVFFGFNFMLFVSTFFVIMWFILCGLGVRDWRTWKILTKCPCTADRLGKSVRVRWTPGSMKNWARVMPNASQMQDKVSILGGLPRLIIDVKVDWVMPASCANSYIDHPL